MRRTWKKWAAALLALLLLLEAADILYVTQGGGSCPLPVLMYHHFAPESTIGTVVSVARFREQMTALRDAGFHTVTLSQLVDYVENGGSMPDKPVLITMDDGYTSNLADAAPILEELGMCATVFVIGVNEGDEIYVHSGGPLTPPRFSYEEAAPWVEKGVLDVQSHTFDLHQLASYGYGKRDGMLPIAGEAEGDYRAALLDDMLRFRARREGRVSTQLMALAYPFGYYCQEADDLLAEQGISVTFTIDERANHLFRGNPRSLRMLGRFNVTDNITGESLVKRLEWNT